MGVWVVSSLGLLQTRLLWEKKIPWFNETGVYFSLLSQTGGEQSKAGGPGRSVVQHTGQRAASVVTIFPALRVQIKEVQGTQLPF